MNRLTQFVIGLLAIGLALGAGYYGRTRYLKEVSTYTVPVPVQAIPAYTILDAGMFQLREMPRTMASLPYHQSIQDLEGLISNVSLPADLPVAQANAIPAEKFRLADADLEVFSIPVEPVSAVGGQIRIGERVNLYQVLPDENLALGVGISIPDPNEFTVTIIASDILVVDVRNTQGVAAEANPQNEENSGFIGDTQNEQVQILTLAVEPQAVDVILRAVAATKKQGGLLWTTLALP